MLVCPRDPTHKRFYARFQESACRHIDQNGEAGDDVRNSLDGEGQISDTWCFDCSRVLPEPVVAIDTEATEHEGDPLPDFHKARASWENQ